MDGIDYFETYAPVVQWATVRILLILSIHLNISTMQVDYTSAFLHAVIEDNVYVEIPTRDKDPGKILQLNKSVYGLKQSHCNLFFRLKSKLEAFEFMQSPADPSLFIRLGIMCLMYVDDCLFFVLNDSNFDDMLQNLRNENLSLEKEDNVAGFLFVHLNVDHDNRTVELTQFGLLDRIIVAMSLINATEIKLPAEYGALPKDKDGELCKVEFNYSTIVEMLLYLQNNSSPELIFTVSQCEIEVETPAKYGAFPKNKHGESCNAEFKYSIIVEMLFHLQNNSRLELTFTIS